jgi:hypothetical protein
MNHHTIRFGEWFLYERHIRLQIRLFGWRRTWYFGIHPPWEERI